MVENVHLKKMLPSVSNTKRVKRSGRQDKHKHNSSFKKFLSLNEDNEDETNADQKKKKYTNIMNPSQEQSGQNVTTVSSTENRNTLQDHSHRKYIDVRA